MKAMDQEIGTDDKNVTGSSRFDANIARLPIR